MKDSKHFSKQASYTTRRNLVWSGLIFIAGAIFGGFAGVFIFLFLVGGTAEPSVPISAPTLVLEAVSTPSEENAAVINTPTVEAIATETSDEGAENIIEISESAPPTPSPEPTKVVASLFRIAASESEARFLVDETFPLGTAVGRTSEIAGDIIVNFEQPAQSQVGTIRINLRTLQTDDPDRDRSIRCCVLLTSQSEFEFAEFVPETIAGLPDSIELNQSVNFSVTGSLTVRGVTNPATFDVQVTLLSDDRLQGFATTTVDRTRFNILNNDENGFDYHGVENEVRLEFDFVALSVPN